MISNTDAINQLNSDALKKAIQSLEKVTYETVSKLIPTLLREEKLILDYSVYTPADASVSAAHGIGRYMLYDHQESDNPFSIWVFAIAPKQKTSIHDHRYRGTVTVLSDAVSEKYYERSSESAAKLKARSDRYRFHTNHDELTDDNFVHQLKRRKELGDGISCTLHIYEMSAYQVNENTGEKRDNRNLNRTFSKEKTPKNTHPDYSQEYPESTHALTI